jgi:hypothetical protein
MLRQSRCIGQALSYVSLAPMNTSTFQLRCHLSLTNPGRLATSFMEAHPSYRPYHHSNQLNLNTGITPVIYCDNQQTVGIVTKATEQLQTKLKHVDIHQL